MEDRDVLNTGEVGFVIAGIKDIYGAPVGDTLTLTKKACETPLPGFKQVQPRVFAGLFPISSDDYENFREALQKLRLNPFYFCSVDRNRLLVHHNRLFFLSSVS